jgi:hypothetical protein
LSKPDSLYLILCQALFDWDRAAVALLSPPI